MIKAIIVEDEPNSRKTLTLMLNRFKKEIELIDVCSGPQEGMESIAKNKPQLVFLDIEMPEFNGFEMLKRIGTINFEVIFTTAYDQYAITAIRLSALDYLLKPIDEEDLRNAIEKCKKNLQQKKVNEKYEVLFNNLGNKNAMEKTIILSSSDGLSVIKTNDIIRCEASRRYTKFYLQNKETMLMSRPLKDYEELLPSADFFRIHESHLINLNYLKKYIRGEGGQVILTDNTELDVARRRKDDFLRIIMKG